ncbi:hypothetical protein ACQKCU_24855 [Heyndrickxia sporothermodurans]
MLYFKSDYYIIHRIYDCPGSPEEEKVIIYELKRIMPDILIDLN